MIERLSSLKDKIEARAEQDRLEAESKAIRAEKTKKVAARKPKKSKQNDE